jgi:predicted XRE-type DNA-binding protein
LIDIDTAVNIRNLIVQKYQEEYPQKRIAEELHVPTSTVCDIVKKYKMTDVMIDVEETVSFL